MDATKLGSALKWKWPDATCDYYFDADGHLNIYNWSSTSQIPQPTEAEVEQAVLDYSSSLVYLNSVFSWRTLQGRLNQEFVGIKAVRLAPYLGALQGFVDWKNWLGMKEFVNGLIVAEIMTAEDTALFKNIVNEQGINLDDFE